MRLLQAARQQSSDLLAAATIGPNIGPNVGAKPPLQSHHRELRILKIIRSLRLAPF
jgi:hypothetical protein